MCDKCNCSASSDRDDAVRPFPVADKAQYAPDSIVSSTIVDNDAGTLTFFAFDAGQSLSTHSAPFDAIVQVIDGQAHITVGGEAHQVRSGEMIVMPANIPHAVEAKQRFKMILTLFRE